MTHTPPAVSPAIPIGQRRPSLVHLITTIIALATLVHTTYFVWKYHSSTPFADFWRWLTDYQAYVETNHYSFHELIKPHDEHRILTTRLLLLADAEWFHMTGHFVAVVNVLLLAGLGLILNTLMRTSRMVTARIVLPASVSIALMASVSQWENMVQPFNVQSALLCFWVASAPPLLIKATLPQPPYRAAFWAALAGLSCFLASFSMAGGLLELPFLLLLLALRRPPAFPAIVFIVAALLTSGLFLSDYHPNGGFSQSSAKALAHPVQAFTFAAGFLGSAFYPFPKLSFTFGIFGLAIFAAASAFIVHSEIVRKTRLSGRLLALWAIAGAFVLMACSAAAFRLLLGLPAALAPRYATLSLTFWACILPIAIEMCLHVDRPWLATALRRSCAVPLMATAALLVLNFTPRFEQDAKEMSSLWASQASSMRQNVYTRGLFDRPFEGIMVEGPNRTAFLHARHLAVFAPNAVHAPPFQALPSIATSAQQLPVCQGQVESAYRLDAKRFVLSGWLASANGRRTADWAELTDPAGNLIGSIPLTQFRSNLPRKLLAQNTPGGFFSGLSDPQSGADGKVTMRMIGIFSGQPKSNCVLKELVEIGPVQLHIPPLTSAPSATPLAATVETQRTVQPVNPQPTLQMAPWPEQKTLLIAGQPGSAPAQAAFTVNTADITSDLVMPFATNASAAAQKIEFSFNTEKPFDAILPGRCPQNTWCTATLPHSFLTGQNDTKLHIVATDPGTLPGEWLALGAPMLTRIDPNAARLY